MNVYKQNFYCDDLAVDPFGRLKPSMLLSWLQTAAGNHFALLEDPDSTLEEKGLFWAVSRHRVVLHKLPRLGQTVTLETWPMPTTRVAYPRTMALYDEEGTLLASAVSLWVLMDKESRALVLPGKSGVTVEGFLRGIEPEVPKGLAPRDLTQECRKTVTYSLLDKNGHMNNARYLDWVDDLLPAAFHRDNTCAEFTVCYLSEALENQQVCLRWALSEEGLLQVDAHRVSTEVHEKEGRIFTAQVLFTK